MSDPLQHDWYYRSSHALFMSRWWSGAICPGVLKPDRAQAALNEAIGWASR